MRRQRTIRVPPGGTFRPPLRERGRHHTIPARVPPSQTGNHEEASMNKMVRSSAFALVALISGAALAQQTVPPPAPKVEKRNMELVGYNDLQGRSAYQPLVHKQGARWIAYIGHHGDHLLNSLTGKEEDNGTSILDVTDPKKPVYLAHIPGEPGKAETGGSQMVRVCDGAELPRADKSKVYLLRPFGNA